MAKAKRVYSGHDTCGRAIEVAERIDGISVSFQTVRVQP